MKKIDFVMLRQAVVSGLLIGIGVVINLLAGNKYIGALLFSFALLTIIHNGIPLYTGRIGFIRENKITNLLLILLFNLIGVIIPVLMIVACKPEVRESVVAASEAKFSYEFWQLFLLGALCGVMMLVAVYSKKEIITVFCIMIFILSGFEHCIADFPFLVLNFSWMNLLKFLCIVLGNSAGSIATYELIRKKSA